MKPTVLIFVLFLCLQTTAQTIGVNLGAGYGRFYSLVKSDGFFNKEFEGQTTFRFGIECKDLKIDSFFRFKFILGFEQYGGSFFESNGGHASQKTEKGKLTKNSLSLQVYPLDFNFLKRATFSLGLAFNISLPSRLEGEMSSWYAQSNPPYIVSSKVPLDQIDGFLRPFNLGVVSSLGYEFVFGKWILEPRYNFHLGLTDEFNQLEATTKSIRQFLTLSLLRKLK
ncbi:MAG: hypothetical protein WC044_11420 [Crocinitomicaceae bacterium]